MLQSADKDRMIMMVAHQGIGLMAPECINNGNNNDSEGNNKQITCIIKMGENSVASPSDDILCCLWSRSLKLINLGI